MTIIMLIEGAGRATTGDNMPAERPAQITHIHQLMAPWVADTPDAPAVRDAHLAVTYTQLDAAARRAQGSRRIWA